MSLSAKLRRAPLRAVTGAFILNAGIGKIGADDETAKHLHNLASGTYPVMGRVDSKLFVKGFGACEVAIGSLVLAPFVSPVVAGAALAGFSGALLKMWWDTPGMHEDGSPRPTAQGTPFAKDAWLLGIGLGLVADGLLEPAHDRKIALGATAAERRAESGRRARRAARKAERANRAALEQARRAVKETQAEAARRAQQAAVQAQRRAQQTSIDAAKRLAEVRAEYAPLVAEKAKSARDAVYSAVDEYGPVIADKAKAAREAAHTAVDEYGPVIADKAKAAREAAHTAVDEYGPVIADKAKAAREAAHTAVDEYGPVIADKAKAAREAAQQAAERAQHAVR